MKDLVIGKVESINKGPNFCNTSILLENKSHFNIKLEADMDRLLEIGKVYGFEVSSYLREDVAQYKAVKITKFEELVLSEEVKSAMLSAFYNYAPLPLLQIKKEIELFLHKINNPVLSSLTSNIYKKFESKFYLHPAATKFHHAYVGGLSYHTLTMLKMIEPMVEIYPYLNKDLLFAATILHDISKIDEITGVDGEYTTEGLLLGHLVMGALEIDQEAVRLGFEKHEEIMMLKHLMVSHHGQLNFGSPKKPQTGEALLLWFIDTIDSKFTELGNALNDVKPGDFTQSINVLDKMRFYKPKL